MSRYGFFKTFWKSILTKTYAFPAKLHALESEYKSLVDDLAGLAAVHKALMKSLQDFETEMSTLRSDPEFGKTDRIKALLYKWESVETGIMDSQTEEDQNAEDSVAPRLVEDIYASASLEPDTPDEFVQRTTAALEREFASSSCADPSKSFTDCIMSILTERYVSAKLAVVAFFPHPFWARLGAPFRSKPQSTPSTWSNGKPMEFKADEQAAIDAYEIMKRDLQSKKDRKEELTKEEDKDFGPERVWEKLSNQCLSFNTPPYTYEVCFHKSAAQKEDSRSVSLGTFTRFGARLAADGNEGSLSQENKNRFLLFSNGEHCWNGPSRSLQIELECAAEADMHIYGVSEPEKCEYNMMMALPIACDEAELTRLQKME